MRKAEKQIEQKKIPEMVEIGDIFCWILKKIWELVQVLELFIGVLFKDRTQESKRNEDERRGFFRRDS